MSDPVNVTFALKRVEKKWEGAIISKGRFVKALIGDDLHKMVTKQLIPYLMSDQEDGVEIALNISIFEAEKEQVVKNDDK